ncbi:hypothetical protein [Embleya sp. NPDC020630]|uniref:hypothetical protein n=1 Tax=Embleya sp. NPDC020630 TaxID=3363979 RepID=UPI0037A9627E
MTDDPTPTTPADPTAPADAPVPASEPEARPSLTLVRRERARVHVTSPLLTAPLVPYTVLGVRRGEDRTIVAAVEGRSGDIDIALTPQSRHTTAFVDRVWNVDTREAMRCVRDRLAGIRPDHDGAAHVVAEHEYVKVLADGVDYVHAPFTVVGLRLPDDTALVLGAFEGEPVDIELACLSDGCVPFADPVWAIDADHALSRAGITPGRAKPVRWWSVYGTCDDDCEVTFHAAIPGEPALDVRHEIPGFGEHTFAHEDTVRATGPERAVRIATERFNAGMRD